MSSISIVIPTHNRAHLISRALDSCLQQETADLEVIVIDDFSDDNTMEVVKAHRQAVVYKKLKRNCGAQYARNFGLDLATGEYIKFLDSDDVLEAGSLRQELSLARETKADIVVSAWAIVDINGGQRILAAPIFSTDRSLIDDVIDGKGVHTSAALYRLNYLQVNKVRWNPGIVKLDDWYFFAHAVLGLGKIERREEVCYRMIAHTGPRLTDASMLDNAVAHHRVLDAIEKKIKTLGELTEERQQRLALYYFKELQVLSLYDWSKVDSAIQKINQLDPEVDPRNGFSSVSLGWLAKLIGIKYALHFYALIKRA